MNRLILLIGVMLCYTACNQNTPPKGVVEREKMLDVMVDMQLTDAYLNQVYNTDTMKMQAHSRYNYIFKKFKIDSANFSNSLKYYSKTPTVLDSMFSQVSDSLTRLQKSLSPKLEQANNSTAQANSIFKYIFGKFKTDRAKYNPNLGYGSLDAKALFGKYNQLLDSIAVQDSLNPAPKRVNEINEVKKIKNDLSTK